MPKIRDVLPINLSKEDQVTKLNSEVKCKLGISPIHGVGVIAMVDIYKGQRCYCFSMRRERPFYNLSLSDLNKLWPEVKELILQRWASIANGSLFLSPNDDTILLLYMNHSDNPNYDLHSDEAMRDIKKGEELTEDYREMLNYEKVYPWLAKK